MAPVTNLGAVGDVDTEKCMKFGELFDLELVQESVPAEVVAFIQKNIVWCQPKKKSVITDKVRVYCVGSLCVVSSLTKLIMWLNLSHR